MGRSFWKGKVIPNNFVSPAYLIVKHFILGETLNVNFVNEDVLVEAPKVYRRNYVMTLSQSKVLKQLPAYDVYNGYDFFKQSLSLNNFVIQNRINLAAATLTREMNAIHKAKLTKAARIKKASTQRKIGTKKNVSKSSLVKRKTVLNKKFRK